MNLKEKELIEFGAECMVLLKSDGHFPLQNIDKIALYGNGVRHTVKGGTGSGDVNIEHLQTIEEAFLQKGFKNITKNWLDQYDKLRHEAQDKFVQNIKQIAKQIKVPAIFVGMGAVMPEFEYNLDLSFDASACLYILSRTSGEGSDRNIVKGDVLLTDTEINTILTLNEKFSRFMLVLNVGGVIDLTPVKDVKNILLMSQLGSYGASSLVDVILGNLVPSGKLSTTWASVNDYNHNVSFGVDDTYYYEGVYVGYRYFNTAKIKPLFPFGHGLSYSKFTFKYQNSYVKDESIMVDVSVRNIGNFTAKEVIQLYLAPPQTNILKPAYHLVAFKKTSKLIKDEEQIISLSFKMKDSAYFDETRGSFILEKGTYYLMLGTSSENVMVVSSITLKDDIIYNKLKEFIKPEFNDQVISCENKYYDVPTLVLTANSFKKEDKKEQLKDQKIINYVEKLDDKKALHLLLGRHSRLPFANVIGNASKTVAGAAGDTFDKIEGLKTLVMADGPAGIRICPRYIKTKKGVKGLGLSIPKDMALYLPKIALKFLDKKPGKKKVYESYKTAIPIGTAVSQSFNLDLAERYGDIIGSEMEDVGINLWLAPALNIQRHILCGRNFEYYSEDPMLSGLMARYVSKGVIKHKGCNVVLKHFACNNQETNRYQNNSVVSNRALREIYLKTFEYALEDNNIKGVMTSYNLLNGVHTAHNETLLKEVLRNEWGFDGIIMSDWIVKGMGRAGCIYDTTDVVLSVMGGNDLFMPGSHENYLSLKKALEDGIISRNIVNEHLYYIVKTIKDLKQ